MVRVTHLAHAGMETTSNPSCENGIEAVKRDAPGAKIDDKTS